MRIGIDIQSVEGGRGPARQTTEIVKALSQVCSVNDSFFLYSPFEKGIETLPSNFVFVHLPLQGRRPWLNWVLPMAARNDKVDVMFFPANDFWLWRAAPAVATLLDIAPATDLFKYLPSWSDRLQNKFQMKSLGRIADKVITISLFSANSITSYLPKVADKVYVVYSGLSAVFQLPEREETSWQQYILFVGGFDRRKNLDRLLQAYKLLLSKGRTERIILAGSAGQNKKLYYDMPELIAFLGLQDTVEIKTGLDDFQLAKLYQEASLFVLPSIVEGFGLPVLEAMACGCPVVASNAASLPEVGGDAARYFDPYNITEMAECIEKVLDDESLRLEMVTKGFDHVKKFSWKRAGEKVYELLKEVANK